MTAPTPFAARAPFLSGDRRAIVHRPDVDRKRARRKKAPMRLTVPDPSLVPFGLRAVKTVATASGPLHPTQRSMIELAQRLILGTQLDIDDLEPITPESLATAIPAPEGRGRIVRGMVLVCMGRGDVTKKDAAAIERYARVLGVTEHAVANVRQLAEGRLALLRYDVNRRAFTGRALAEARESEGLLALLRAAASRAGFREDEATAAKYEALANYPEGTLGRELWAYYERNHFPVPGRLHAIPAFATVHDLCHVLSGYGVDGPGEIEVVAFQAGFMERDPLSTLFVAVLQAHLGVRLVAIAPGNKGALDDPAMLERMIRAAKRGSHVKRDLFDHWDYWPELSKDIGDVRERLGVEPPEAV
jgi:ubiquinone biosynthesis protein Coq4